MRSIENQDSVNVYLAGAIEYAPDGGKKWRSELGHFLINELGHDLFDPTSEEWDLLDDEEKKFFREWKTTNLPRFQLIMRRVIEHDLNNLLNRTNYVICYWDDHVRSGGGTHGEMTLAYMNQIPVYMVHDMPLEKMSSWIIGCATELFPDFESLKTFLRGKYKSPKP